MAYGFMDIASTPSVQAAQASMGADHLWQDFKGHREFDRFTENEAAFIAERDSFYLATVSETGWPYVQHRGGPRGFIRALDDRTLGFVDFAGNRQYVSTGNLRDNARVCLFLIDYARRRRIKVWGTARTVPATPELLAALALPGYRARIEQVVLVTVSAWDVNCPQHIPQKLDAAEVAGLVDGLRARIAELEAELARTRAA